MYSVSLLIWHASVVIFFCVFGLAFIYQGKEENWKQDYQSLWVVCTWSANKLWCQVAGKFNHISHFSNSRLSLEANVNGSLSDQMCHTCVKLFSFVTKLAQNVLQHFKTIEFSGSTSCPSILEYVRTFVPNFTKLPQGFPENSVHGRGEKKDRDRQTMHKHCLWRQLSSA